MEDRQKWIERKKRDRGRKRKKERKDRERESGTIEDSQK
jgi:hypothetical protein